MIILLDPLRQTVRQKEMNLFTLNLSFNYVFYVFSSMSYNVVVFMTSHRLKATNVAGRDALSRCGCVWLLTLPRNSSARPRGLAPRRMNTVLADVVPSSSTLHKHSSKNNFY